MEAGVSDSLTARLTRRSGTSFYNAFLLLPPAKRAALYALYSFCRAVDDCVDEPGGGGAAGLDRWSGEVERAYAGRPDTAVGRALAEALGRFAMPKAALLSVVEGCRMDLEPRIYATFSELRTYCERVASAVGLAAIEIFGYRDPGTRSYARELGVALQLTNILRDLTGDAEKRRLYIPRDEIETHGLAPESLLAGALGSAPRTEAMDRLLESQGERARRQYDDAARLLPAEDRHSMRPAQVMAATYGEILARLRARGFPFGDRLRLSRLTKAWVALRTVARESLA